MSKRWWGMLAVMAGTCGLALGQETDHAKPILDKAVQALGGGDKQKLAGITFDTQSKFMISNNNLEFRGSWSVQGFDKVHGNLDLNNDGIKKSVVIVMNGMQLWGQDDGRTEMAPAEVLPSVQGIFRAICFAQRPRLLRDKDIKLSPLGELVVNNAACVGLKIEQKNCRDLNLYFDKATGLPAKAEVTIQEGPNGPDTVYDFFFSEFKETDGVKHFTKMTVKREQQQITEVELSNFRLQEDLNANLFQKP